MQINHNTILITGGGSGIGRALAEKLKAEGNEVIVAGRSAEKLKHAASKELATITVDMTSEQSIRALADQAISKFPKLNVVIHNAGIMKNEKVTSKDAGRIAAETIATNLTGPILLTHALIPHFLKQKHATIMTVTSGLAFVPFAMTPTYSATKAAIHSYTDAIRFQLQNTNIEVKELIPPYVRTSLMGDRQAQDQNAMPLDEFINEVISILKENPAVNEIAVKRVRPQRTAVYGGAEAYNGFLKQQNDRLMTARKAEWDAIS